MKSANPYLNFNGNTEEAFEFDRSVFGGDYLGVLRFRDFSDNPMRVPLEPESGEEAERLFAALSEGGRVERPLEQTAWAEEHGMCVDRFGVQWMIDYARSIEFEHGPEPCAPARAKLGASRYRFVPPVMAACTCNPRQERGTSEAACGEDIVGTATARLRRGSLAVAARTDDDRRSGAHIN